MANLKYKFELFHEPLIYSGTALWSRTDTLTITSTSQLIVGLGQFGAAVSATSRFGDGTFRRWWSQMYYAKKCVFWNTL